MRAGDVDVVGFGEAVADRDSAGEEFDVEGGPWGIVSLHGNVEGFWEGGALTGVIDQGVDVPWTGLDLLKSLLDGFVAGEVDLDRFDGAGRLRTFLVEGFDG